MPTTWILPAVCLAAACSTPRSRSTPLARPTTSVPAAPPAAPTPAPPTGELMWRGAVDLDGDGRMEDVTVHFADDGAQDGESPLTTGVITVGAKAREIVLYKENSGGAIFRTIDIDARDRSKELLIEQFGEHPTHPTYRYSIASLYGGDLGYQELDALDGRGAEVAVDGRGTLTLQRITCRDGLDVVYRLEAGRVVEVERVPRAPLAECPEGD